MKADREAKDRKVSRDVVWMPQPAPQCVSLLFSTAPSSRENRGVMAASPAPQLEKQLFCPLVSWKEGFFLPSPRDCYAKLVRLE